MKFIYQLAVVRLVIWLLLGCARKPDYAGNGPNGTGATNENTTGAWEQLVPADTAGKGTLVVSVTDAARDVAMYEEFRVTIKDVEIYTTGGEWIDLAQEDKKIDLLELKNQTKQVLIVEDTIDAGTYSRIKFSLTEVTAKTATGTIEFETREEIELPVQVDVDENQNSYILIDVELEKSQVGIQTGDADWNDEDELIFEPYLTISVMANADVYIQDEQGTIYVRIKWGEVQSRASGLITIDMDEESGTGSDVDEGAVLDLEGGWATTAAWTTTAGTTVGGAATTTGTITAWASVGGTTTAGTTVGGVRY